MSVKSAVVVFEMQEACKSKQREVVRTFRRRRRKKVERSEKEVDKQTGLERAL